MSLLFKMAAAASLLGAALAGWGCVGPDADTDADPTVAQADQADRAAPPPLGPPAVGGSTPLWAGPADHRRPWWWKDGPPGHRHPWSGSGDVSSRPHVVHGNEGAPLGPPPPGDDRPGHGH